jgi:hypothetical protein
MDTGNAAHSTPRIACDAHLIDKPLIGLSFVTEVISIMKTIQITLDDRLHRRAKTLAFMTGHTLADLVRMAVHEHVARVEAEASRKARKR